MTTFLKSTLFVCMMCVYVCVAFRTHYRRQKKWWSAYLLFYDRIDQEKVFEGEKF